MSRRSSGISFSLPSVCSLRPMPRSRSLFDYGRPPGDRPTRCTDTPDLWCHNFQAPGALERIRCEFCRCFFLFFLFSIFPLVFLGGAISVCAGWAYFVAVLVFCWRRLFFWGPTLLCSSSSLANRQLFSQMHIKARQDFICLSTPARRCATRRITGWPCGRVVNRGHDSGMRLSKDLCKNLCTNLCANLCMNLSKDLCARICDEFVARICA